MAKGIIIFGAGDTGRKAFHALGRQYEIVAFADNCPGNYGKNLLGVPVISPEGISAYDVELLIIARSEERRVGKEFHGFKKHEIVLAVGRIRQLYAVGSL